MIYEKQRPLLESIHGKGSGVVNSVLGIAGGKVVVIVLCNSL